MEDLVAWKMMWGFFVTGATGIMGFFGMRTIFKLDKVSDRADQNMLDLERFKTDVASNYASSAAIARVHDKLEGGLKDSAHRLEDGLKEIRGDIKLILGKIK